MKTIHAIGIQLSSAVIIDRKDFEDNEIKDDKLGDIWWIAPKSKTHKEDIIPEELEDYKPIWEVDIALHVTML